MILYLHNKVWIKEPETLHMIIYLQLLTHMFLQTKPNIRGLQHNQVVGSCKPSVSNTTKLQGPDSPEDDLVIIVNESDEDEPNAETEDTSVPRSSSPSSLPAELKDLPSKFNELTKDIKGLKT
uniref:Uncharacterized protein n=1 Tax=Tanacetum cinerariifolium TaxID=118510 RepID=A0A699K4N6_TANCI|nr:hypothetical protein [Tanacetum cinerariifolium]